MTAKALNALYTQIVNKEVAKMTDEGRPREMPLQVFEEEWGPSIKESL